jgi:3-phenylpropionate/cinnamic acid dioxygenase small subunit
MSDPISQYAIKQEILDLLSVRASAADRFDPDLMRACHPPDATDNHGTYQGRMYDFIANLEKRQKDGPLCTGKLHVLGNALFEFKGEDIFVETYHVAHETFVEERGPVDFRIGGRYLDTFRQINGRWLIQRRDIVYDWSRIDAATPPGWNPDNVPAALLGKRSPDDPHYAFGRSKRGALPGLSPRIARLEDNNMDAIQQLLGKQAITEVLYRRARAGDRADADLAHTCYHPGATERHGEFDGLATDFIDKVSFTRPRPGSPIKGMFHFLSNILVDFTDDDNAFVESYHVAWVQMTDGSDAVIGGRYFDRFGRREGRWAITHRDVIFDWSRVEPETVKFWDRHPAKPFLFGHRGESDPLYTYVRRGT